MTSWVTNRPAHSEQQLKMSSLSPSPHFAETRFAGSPEDAAGGEVVAAREDGESKPLIDGDKSSVKGHEEEEESERRQPM